MSGTFKTEVSFGSDKFPALRSHYDSIRLPASVNLIALRESFLSEAPFVTHSNRMFWRRMVDGECFQNLIAISFHIVSDCVSENSVVDVDKLNNIREIPLIPKMASNLAEMYYSIKTRERDTLFTRLPEVCAFMVVSALRTSVPKHHRLCQSTKFREILLDWYCEVLGGVRFSNCRANREWFFQDVFDVPILTSSQMNPGTPQSSSAGSPTRSYTSGTTRSKHTIALSPLINMYTGESKAKNSELTVHLSLSHAAARPLTTLPLESLPQRGRVRARTVDTDAIKSILNSSKESRKKILSDHRMGIKQSNRDIRKLKARYKKTLKALSQTPTDKILSLHATV
jgi:hypothetical protein